MVSEEKISQDQKGFPFDPGFVAHLSAFVPNIEFAYSSLERYRNFNQKKMQFRMYYPKIVSLINNYIAFYLGCISWAVYIKNFEGADILNNLCYGGEYNEQEILGEVDFVEEYLEQFKKDVKYYLGQDYIIDERYLKVIKVYKEFLALNEGFVNVQKTDDIKLPNSVKNPNNIDFIKEKIDESVENGLAVLLELFDMVL